MTNTLKLRAAIISTGISRKEIAKMIGISEHSLHKKIHNITEFKASEISELAKILEIENKEEIFFVQE